MLDQIDPVLQAREFLLADIAIRSDIADFVTLLIREAGAITTSEQKQSDSGNFDSGV
ncbi:MAG: hypothetical protein ACKOWI_03230 [Rhodoluna sp.]